MNKIDFYHLKTILEPVMAVFETEHEPLAWDTCINIDVARFNPDWLEMTPVLRTHTGSLVGVHSDTRIVLFDRGKNFVVELKQEIDSRSNYAYTDPRYEKGESILEALADLRELTRKRVFLIAVFKRGHRVVDHYSTDEWELEVYTVRDNLNKAVKDRMLQAREKLEALRELQA